MNKTIDLRHVRNALMCAIVRRAMALSGSKPMARMAAYTLNPEAWGPDCRHPQRDVLASGSCLSCMTVGHLPRVVNQTHLLHGAAQVRRIWGKGLRALQVEMRGGLMR